MRNILSGLVAAFPPTPGHPTMSTSLLYFHAKTESTKGREKRKGDSTSGHP